MGLGRASGDRPILNKVEQLVDGFAARPPATTNNPSEMSELLKSVSQLTEQVRALDERLKALESKASAPSAPSIPPPPTSGFAPLGNP
jgi:hypothetical protein